MRDSSLFLTPDNSCKKIEKAGIVLKYKMKSISYWPKFQCDLALCYLLGDRVPKNSKEAVRLFRLAADQGHQEARNYLANCYLDGEGVEKDYEQAMGLYIISAKQGNIAARNYLNNGEESEYQINEVEQHDRPDK